MKITITAFGGTAFLLADDTVTIVPGSNWPSGAGGQIKQGFVNKQERRWQRAPLLRAAYSAMFPRYNLQNRLSFLVQRTFSTVESCVAFIAGHPDSVPAQGELTVDNQSSTGRVLRYLPNATVERVECVRHLGMACDFQYVISGSGAWQSTA